VTGGTSHQLVTSDVSRILWLYYNDSGIFSFAQGSSLSPSTSLNGSRPPSLSTTSPIIANLTFPSDGDPLLPDLLPQNVINIVQLWKASTSQNEQRYEEQRTGSLGKGSDIGIPVPY
jgi:CDP-diacylglycerol--inositol 3-phosphatidyltransferase